MLVSTQPLAFSPLSPLHHRLLEGTVCTPGLYSLPSHSPLAHEINLLTSPTPQPIKTAPTKASTKHSKCFSVLILLDLQTVFDMDDVFSSGNTQFLTCKKLRSPDFLSLWHAPLPFHSSSFFFFLFYFPVVFWFYITKFRLVVTSQAIQKFRKKKALLPSLLKVTNTSCVCGLKQLFLGAQKHTHIHTRANK